jgi:hypothetical protein
MVRDFIGNSLYNPERGYFVRQDVIISPSEPIAFNAVWGKWEYEVEVAKRYEDKPRAWMTPVEIFAPFFSQALARYMLIEHAKANESVDGGPPPLHPVPLVVYEVGGGAGTNALHVLNFIRDAAPHVYATMEYKMVEISSSMVSRQRERLKGHACASVVHADMLQGPGGEAVEERPCFALLMEVLDNLPHDKVVYDSVPPEEGGARQWRQVAVTGDGSPGDPYRESKQPLSDPLLLRALQLNLCPLEPASAAAAAAAAAGAAAIVAPAGARGQQQEQPPPAPEPTQPAWLSMLSSLTDRVMAGGSASPDAAFVPTGAVQLMESLLERLPQHRLIAADFRCVRGSSTVTVPSPLTARPEAKISHQISCFGIPSCAAPAQRAATQR